MQIRPRVSKGLRYDKDEDKDVPDFKVSLSIGGLSTQFEADGILSKLLKSIGDQGKTTLDAFLVEATAPAR